MTLKDSRTRNLLAESVKLAPNGFTVQRVLRDFVVIPKADLPEVWINPQRTRIADGGAAIADRPGHNSTSDAPHHWKRALAHLALVESLINDPPVDEAQVDALASSVQVEAGAYGHVVLDSTAAIIARRLVAAGWKREEK